MKYKQFSPSDLNKTTHPHLSLVSQCWQSEGGVYIVLFDEPGKYKHLRIRRTDDLPIHNWMDVQEIKNDLWGKDCVAVEVYPADTDFKDGSNTYHLWTWEGIKAPNLNQLYEYAQQEGGVHTIAQKAPKADETVFSNKVCAYCCADMEKCKKCVCDIPTQFVGMRLFKNPTEG